MTALIDALRRKFKTPREAMLALGLDADLLGPRLGLDAALGGNTEDDSMARFTKARSAGGRDEAVGEFQDLVNDPEASFGDVIAAAIEAMPEEMQPEVYQSLREMGEDSRGPRSWARDRMERRRLSKDSDARLRRFGRDDPMPRNGIEEDRGGAMAGDRMALDASPRGMFARLFPNASRVERA